jgi:Tfp pilus assembly protein PilF
LKRARTSAFVFVSALLLAAACTPSTPAQNPDDNPPPLEGDGPKTGEGPAAPASSPKVKEGMDAIQAGDFAKAKEVLTAAEVEAPNDPQAAFYMGVALEGSGDAEGAAEKYERALKLDPKLAEASVNLSALLLDGGDAKRSLEVVDAGLKTAPKHPGLLMNRALALEASGDAAGALDAYGKAVAAQPDNLELRYAHAELLAGAGKKDEALAELRKVAASDDVKLLAAAANVFGKLQAFGDCVSALDKAVRKKGAPELFTRRGVCRHEMKDDAGAKGDFEAALKLDPKFAPAHYYLGMHYKALGKAKEAKTELQKAVELGGNEGVGAAAKKALDELGKKP